MAITKLDANQVIKDVYDEVENRLRVDAEVTAVIGDIEVHIDQASDSIRIGDGTDLITGTNVDGKIGLDVNVLNPIGIFTLPYDSITATYPTTTQEVYKSRIGGISGAVQETATVNYTDATKDFILNVVRT